MAKRISYPFTDISIDYDTLHIQEWNPDLAMVAQNYAETCMFNPNPNRAAQAPFDTVGENRAFGRTTNYTDLIERGWFVVQRNNFDFNSNMCLSPGACDEYIQVHKLYHATV